MKWIGLTGGIACGKSTVSQMLQARGFPVIDADLLAREVVQPGSPCLNDIAQEFGADVIAADGTLDRAKLGSIVFAQPSRRVRLEEIIHPRVRRRTLERRQELEAQRFAAAFYDVPLLFEKNMQSLFDCVVVVSCRPDVQLARLMSRNHLTESEARLRIGAQWPMQSKEAGAHQIIRNNGDTAALEAEVLRVLHSVGLATVHHGQT